MLAACLLAFLANAAYSPVMIFLNERYPTDSPDKHICVTARALADAGQSWVRIVVEDNGTGIAPDYAASDQYYADEAGGDPRTVVVDGAGTVEEVTTDTAMKFVCAYPLVR